MCLATSNNLLLVLYDAPKRIFSMNSRSSGRANQAGLLTPLTFANFTLPTFKAFLGARSQNVFGNKQ